MKKKRCFLITCTLLIAQLQVQMGIAQNTQTSTDSRLIRFEQFVYGLPTPNDSTPIVRRFNTYPSPTELIERTEQFQAGGWVPQGLNTSKFDDQQRLLLNTQQLYNAATKQYTPILRFQVFPKETNGLADSTLTYSWDVVGNKWDLTSRIKGIYNNQGQLLETQTSAFIAGQIQQGKALYFYDAANNNIKTETYTIVGGVSILNSFAVYTIENGQLANSTTYSVSPTKDTLPAGRLVNQYTSSGLVSKAESFTWDSTARSWVLIATTQNEYDANQRLSSRVFSYIELNQKIRTDFFYTPKNDIAIEANYRLNAGATNWKLESKGFFFYDQASSLQSAGSQARSLAISPNPSAGKIRLDLPHNASFQVFNTAGKLISSGQMNQQNGEIDLSPFPAGVYWIRAREGAKTFVGRVIKQ
ncbi:MAG TPA: T9SS type A sorting domain-containing protein [Haliscomenobacter sp.]|uniref:T9SS type A sorting domain-containing protein n=1 Tax=Haliscomenobacter sp. TaxID=2717303 RepID=UPI002CCE3EA8|nr:T9SS type A sorting domain-containing protein [Haliscomenobacter sp.]HOY16583.1 T9SS type A sorting domain-containing protein [Haliscomenobacter sp.]HPH17710.1 T9SS type A sorting domain-containing protein [Haliscomenobacter sp.]